MRIKPIISNYCFDCEEVREHSFEGYSDRYKTYEYCCMHCAESVYYSRKSLKRSYNRRKRDNYFTRKGIIHKTSLINRLRFSVFNVYATIYCFFLKIGFIRILYYLGLIRNKY